jgi:hypothetical protein
MPAADERGAHAPQPALTTAEELAAPPATEPELKEAVADLDAAPIAAPPAPSPAPEPANAPPALDRARTGADLRQPGSIAAGADTAAASRPATGDHRTWRERGYQSAAPQRVVVTPQRRRVMERPLVFGGA